MLRMASAPLDVSVLMPFGDDEDVVGTAATRVADHLRSLGLRFELLAVEENSGDNSHALLGLLRKQIPELEVLYAEGRERGYSTAANSARGVAVWLIEPQAALKPLALFSRAFRMVESGDVDAVIARGKFAVCHRMRSLPAVLAMRGRRFGGLRRRIERGRKSSGRVVVLGSRRWLSRAEPRPFSRLIHAFSKHA